MNFAHNFRSRKSGFYMQHQARCHVQWFFAIREP